MNNKMVRKALHDAGVKQWELARKLGIGENTLSRRMRSELPEKQATWYTAVIEEIRKEKEHADR